MALSPLFSGKLTKKLIDVIDAEFLAADKGANTGINGSSVLASPAWILGTCMRALQQRPPIEWPTEINISDWIQGGIKEWGSSPEFLAGLTPLARSRCGVFSFSQNLRLLKVTVFSKPSTPIPFAEIYPHLQASLLSHSRILRLNALRLLDSKIVFLHGGIYEVMKRCLQGEEVSLDVQGVRERVLRIGRVVQVVGDADSAEFCARWLIGMLVCFII